MRGLIFRAKMYENNTQSMWDLGKKATLCSQTAFNACFGAGEFTDLL